MARNSIVLVPALISLSLSETQDILGGKLRPPHDSLLVPRTPPGQGCRLFMLLGTLPSPGRELMMALGSGKDPRSR